MSELKLFIPITKVDEEKRLVYGIATAEEPDVAGEICDYETTVPYYKAWSERIEKASEGKSKGNLRSMHTSIAAGKITQISFNDAAKQIEICGKVVDDDEWKKVTEGVYTGFSQGGRYIKTWRDGEYTRYTADPCEVSLVDNPCLPTATFTMLRMNGIEELRKFKTMEQNQMAKKKEKIEIVAPEQVWKAKDGSTFSTKAEALQKNAEIEAANAAAPAVNAAAEMDKILTKAEEGDDDGEDSEAEKNSNGPVEKTEDKKDSDEKDGDTGEKDKAEKSITIKIKKGLFEVSRLASLIQELAWLQECCENEALWEMDGSKTPAELMASIKSLGAILTSMCAEEVSELVGTEMTLSAKIESLAKRGAKISAASKAHLDSMHKSATAHMAEVDKCYKALMDMKESEEDDKAEKLAKSAAAIEETAGLKNENEALKKQISALNESSEKILERVKKLESQPLPTAKGKLFRVEKGHELEEETGNAVEADKNFSAIPNRISPEEYRRQYNF
jgi:hypothetical protein